MSTIRKFSGNKLITMLAVMVIMVSCMVTPAFADWTPEGAISNKDFTTTSITQIDIQTYAKGEGVTGEGKVWTASNSKELLKMIRNSNIGDKGQGTQISIDNNVYVLDEAGLQKCKNYMVSVTKKYDVKSSVDGMGTNFNVKADTETAGIALSGLESVVSVIVGILCYAITLGMTLFTALDLCYITMPVFRNKCEDMKQSGGGAMVKTNKETGETQLRWITDEAVYSVQVCAIETGKSPLTMYLKKRVIAFVMLAIVLFILFTGNIQLIVNIAINFIAGLMDALSSLGA